MSTFIYAREQTKTPPHFHKRNRVKHLKLFNHHKETNKKRNNIFTNY